ncbi:hypothetical protein [Achromobacter sp. NFACC18-2]|uniref:hypothetical protein n=1 Tax=Achromobacter sp. NFACC18-2 TaxID=1564112 RepID=UPI0008B3C8D0|nr:hypothetical protein [Achromobacter sp. NFACC18-2]SEJ85001.1 hypothetical protein SAMN03159494_03569 [Achromobacter sp. NFACC18-2]
MKHTDFLGNPVAVGDMVAYVEPNYRSMALGKVLALTPQGFWVSRRDYRGEEGKTLRTREYISKVTG